MAKTRTSIELYPGGWRLVEVQVSASGRRATKGDVRVTAFLSAASSGDVGLGDLLGRVRQERKLEKEAWVTLWGLRSTQQLLRLPPAKPEALEALAIREARKEIAPFESPGEPASVAVVAGSETLVGTTRRREVSLVAVSSADVRQRIQPLVDAGFIVRGVSTPAMALATLARSRQQLTPGTAAYVAIVSEAICLAIVRDGVLLFAREMPWGHQTGDRRQDERGKGLGDAASPPADTIEARLASELKRSILFFKQTFRAPVEALVICGDMPNLRALTAPLGEALGVPVQPLDSLVGLDAAAVPEPAEQFRAEAAALRLAIATGADAAPTGNLLPTAIRKVREAHRQFVQFGAGLAAGVLLIAGWWYVVNQTAASQRDERVAIEKELSILEPDAMRLADLRQAYTMTTSRQAALAAFDSQGPRLARLLEILSRATPEDVILTSLEVQPDGPAWDAHLVGTALSADSVVAQDSVNALLQALSDSPFVGPSSAPPSIRVMSGTGATIPDRARTTIIPQGMTGVEFDAHYELAK